METVQLAITNAHYSKALREMLLRNGSWNVQCVEAPNPDQGGVIVLDRTSLDSLPTPLADAERVVLITRNEPGDLSRAWEAGIVSLVFENDSLNTAMLAIMAAGLRLAKGARKACLPSPERPRKPRPAGRESEDPPMSLEPASGRAPAREKRH